MCRETLQCLVRVISEHQIINIMYDNNQINNYVAITLLATAAKTLFEHQKYILWLEFIINYIYVVIIHIAVRVTMWLPEYLADLDCCSSC